MLSLPNNEFEFGLLAKKEASGGVCGPFDDGGDNSKSGEEASNFKKLFDELQS